MVALMWVTAEMDKDDATLNHASQGRAHNSSDQSEKERESELGRMRHSLLLIIFKSPPRSFSSACASTVRLWWWQACRVTQAGPAPLQHKNSLLSHIKRLFFPPKWVKVHTRQFGLCGCCDTVESVEIKFTAEAIERPAGGPAEGLRFRFDDVLPSSNVWICNKRTGKEDAWVVHSVVR